MTIPASVTSMGHDAFLYCQDLTGIWVDAENPSYSNDERGVLFNKDKTELLAAPTAIAGAYTIPNSVTDIAESAFYHCERLKSVEIPDSVTCIGNGVFSNCLRLESATIPDGITIIGDEVFGRCHLLKSITIPDGVTSIGYSAFSGCTALESIHLPSKLTELSGSILAGCSALRDITIPDSVTSIGSGAFYGCSALTSLTIPDGVTDLAGGVFSNCTALTSVNIPDGVTEIDSYLFENCRALTSVTIPAGVTSIGMEAFYGCEALTSVTIPKGVTFINSYAFFGCTGLESIYFLGNAPGLSWRVFCCPVGETDNAQLIPGLTFYYLEGTEGWNDSDWMYYTKVLHEHSYTDAVTPPTCTEQGYTTHTCICTVSYVDTYVDALGHAMETDAAVAATCTQSGLTEGSHCSRCDEATVVQTVIQPLGHSFAGGSCTVCGAAGANVDDFTDVPRGEWYYDAVNFAVTNGLFNGTSDTTFEPDSSMTRAMLVTVLWRLEGEPAPTQSNPFTDVPAGQWYTDAILWAAENEIVNGVGDGKFDPNGNVTREQMAAIMFRYADKKGYNPTQRADLSGYPDSGSVSAWASESLSRANAVELINGSKEKDGKTYLLSTGNATRAQVATILMRYVQVVAR